MLSNAALRSNRIKIGTFHLFLASNIKSLAVCRFEQTIYIFLSSAFGLYQLLKEIPVSSAVKCSISHWLAMPVICRCQWCLKMTWMSAAVTNWHHRIKSWDWNSALRFRDPDCSRCYFTSDAFHTFTSIFTVSVNYNANLKLPGDTFCQKMLKNVYHCTMHRKGNLTSPIEELHLFLSSR